MSDEELSGEELLKRDMAAFESGEEPEEAKEPEMDLSEPEEAEEMDLSDPEEEADYTEKDGFMSKEAWEAAGNDPDDYLSPDDFNLVGEMRDDKNVSRTQLAKQFVQTTRQMQEMMAQQNKMLKDQEERIRAEERSKWEAKLNEARDYGNIDDALEAKEELDKIDRPIQQPQQPQIDPSVQDFYNNNNDWYGVDDAPTRYFNVLAERNQQAIANAAAQGVPFSQAVAPIMEKVKAKYGQYFVDEQPKRQKQPNLRPRQISEKSTTKAKGEKKYSLKDIDESLRPFARSMIKKTNMSEHEYVKQMVEQ